MPREDTPVTQHTRTNPPQSPSVTVLLNDVPSAGMDSPASWYSLHSLDLGVPRRADTEVRIGFPPESGNSSGVGMLDHSDIPYAFSTDMLEAKAAR